MSSREISLATVVQEMEDAREYSELYGWEISAIDVNAMLFTVLMRSPIDEEKYLIEFGFENYPELPYLIDFVHPITGERRNAKCMPKCMHDNFFQPNAFIICHPCSRRAYKGYSNLHGDWSMEGWKANANGTTDLKSILNVIYTRISDKTNYVGRMDKTMVEKK
jgi:hypothetical protein